VEDHRLLLQQRVAEAKAEMQAGAYKIIIEARESGTVGIFDESGKVNAEFTEQLAAQIGLDNVIFEAPQHPQQVWLLSNLGNTVNLGNIAPEQCISLETLRCGLRADTLKTYHMARTSLRLENGVGGAYSAGSRGDIVIVVDALRSSSSIVTALAAGMRHVKPVVSALDCVGEVTAGERGGKKIPQLQYDNSPLLFRDTPEFKGKELVLTDSNGTECIHAAALGKSTVLIGCMLNARAVAAYALELAGKTGRNISLAMAGRNNQLAQEDLLSASEIAFNLNDCELLGSLRLIYSDNTLRDFLESESGKNLSLIGMQNDVRFCAGRDIYSIVPIYQNGVITIADMS
jgi:phosphosulfolactate phosphohydrolase-like enzyme